MLDDEARTRRLKEPERSGCAAVRSRSLAAAQVGLACCDELGQSACWRRRVDTKPLRNLLPENRLFAYVLQNNPLWAT
jgi:hypothetical protein